MTLKANQENMQAMFRIGLKILFDYRVPHEIFAQFQATTLLGVKELFATLTIELEATVVK